MYKTTYRFDAPAARTLFVRVGTVFIIVVLANIFVWRVLKPVPTAPFSVRATMFWNLKSAPDILFIGSSITRENIDEKMVSSLMSVPGRPVTAFNLGITGGGPIVERAILKGIVLNRIDRGEFDTPELWVFEYHPLELAPNFRPEDGMRQVETLRNWTERYDDLDSLPEFFLDLLKHGMGTYERALFDQYTYSAGALVPLLRLDRDWATKDMLRRKFLRGLAAVGLASPPAAVPALQALESKWE